MQKLFLISGLPRSGSTLLCNILHQNENLFVHKATSGLHEVLFAVRSQWDRLLEHRAEGCDYEKLKRVLNSIAFSYHNTNKQYIIDKSRGWLALIETLEFMLGYTPKIIVPVRNLSEIFSSFEKLWRKSTGFTQWNFEKTDLLKTQTVEGRCELWAGADQTTGMAYNRVKDVITKGYKDKLFFCEFDNLTYKPDETFRAIYEYLELPYFQHNFNNVEQYTQEDDIGVHRIPNLHKIKNKIEIIPHDSHKILGQTLFNKYSNLEIWRY